MTDWVHRTHIRKIHPRPCHLEDDSEDEAEFEPENTLREMFSKNDPDESRGVSGGHTDNIKVEDTSSSSLNTSRNDTIRSESNKKVCETEKEMAELLQKSLKSRQMKRRRTISDRNRKKNISEIAVQSRKSGRERRAPERLQISTKGKSYDPKSST